MAGMLPGVECARRRRFHQNSGWPADSPSTSTRRPSFCLYTRKSEPNLSSISPVTRRSRPATLAYCNERLADAARQAKERLDERLRLQWKSQSKRASNGQNVGSRNRQINNRSSSGEPRELQSTEVLGGGVKKSGAKRFSWAIFSGRKSDDGDKQQEECAVCLEQFNEGENLMQLPCVHRFHSRCLLPWLENNPHCPCCRMEF